MVDMRAVRFDHYGSVDVLEVREVEDPVAGPGEVLVAVKAAGINPGEISIREGQLTIAGRRRFRRVKGRIRGRGAGVGGGVDAFAEGAEVIGWTDGRASHAELVVVPGAQLTARPARCPWEVAARCSWPPWPPTRLSRRSPPAR